MWSLAKAKPAPDSPSFSGTIAPVAAATSARSAASRLAGSTREDAGCSAVTIASAASTPNSPVESAVATVANRGGRISVNSCRAETIAPSCRRRFASRVEMRVIWVIRSHPAATPVPPGETVVPQCGTRPIADFAGGGHPNPVHPAPQRLDAAQDGHGILVGQKPQGRRLERRRRSPPAPVRELPLSRSYILLSQCPLTFSIEYCVLWITLSRWPSAGGRRRGPGSPRGHASRRARLAIVGA